MKPKIKEYHKHDHYLKNLEYS